MNLKNLALAIFVSLTIVFGLVAINEADRSTPSDLDSSISTTTITSFSTVYSVTTSTSVIVNINGSQQLVLCEATTYSAAGTVTSGQTFNPTTTLGSTTYAKTTNVTETSGYAVTSTLILGPPTAPPYEVITCTYVS